MCNETPIDASNWPQPGEIWKTRNGLEYGPLILNERGILTYGTFGWTPSGHFYGWNHRSEYDLIARVEKLPEPIERFINVHPGKVDVIYAYDDAFQAKRCVSANGKTVRARITFLEEVK